MSFTVPFCANRTCWSRRMRIAYLGSDVEVRNVVALQIGPNRQELIHDFEEFELLIVAFLQLPRLSLFGQIIFEVLDVYL